MRNNGPSTRIMLHSIIHAVLQKYYGDTAEYLSVIYRYTNSIKPRGMCICHSSLATHTCVQYSLSLPVDTYTCEGEGLMHA